MYRLSIIIPHYNSPKTLRELLESIVREAGPEVQIIVSDDNSTEYLNEYEELVGQYSDRVLFVKNNRGIKGAGVARNVALENAEGEDILFADADDYFLPGWYSIVCEYIEKDADIVLFTPTCWNVTENQPGWRVAGFSKYVKALAKGQKWGEIEARYMFTPVWSKLIRRSIVVDNGIEFDPTMHSNDVMFAMKSAFYAKKFVADERNIYCVTQREGTLTRNHSADAICVRFTVLGERTRFLKKNLSYREYAHLIKVMGFYEKLQHAKELTPDPDAIKRYVRIYRKYRLPLFRSKLEYKYRDFKKKHGKPFVYVKQKIRKLTGKMG